MNRLTDLGGVPVEYLGAAFELILHSAALGVELADQAGPALLTARAASIWIT